MAKNWIQKAVNPKHKGYCTPMSKSTCTPRRKALARTFKKMAKNRKREDGGETIPKPNYLFPEGIIPSHEDSLLYNTYFQRILNDDKRAIEDYEDIKKSGIPKDLSESVLYHLNLKKNAYDDASKYKKSITKYAEGGAPFGLIGNIGAGLVDSTIPVDEETGKGVIGKDIASDSLKMAGAGAQIGTMIAPGVGTAIGAGAGAILGAGTGFLRGKSEKKQYIEDAKNNYQDSQENIDNQRPRYFANGGMLLPQPNLIEVEGDELEVSNGKVLKDFKNKNSHENGGYQYEAKPGRIIIPSKDRDKYLKSDNFTRNSMERRLVLDQKKRENLQSFKKGGKIQKYKKGGLPETNYINYDENGNQITADSLYKQPINPVDTWSSPRYKIPSNGLVSTPQLGNTYDGRFTKNTNWSELANQTATYLPPIYNAVMGFSKANTEKPIYNKYSDETLNTMRNRRIDLDPIKQDIYTQERIASAPLGENQGSYLSRRTQLSANTQKALTEANLKAQEVNNQYSADYANTLNNIGQQRRAADFDARQQTLKNLYNKSQYLPTAVTQTGQIGRENLNIPLFADTIKNKYAMSLLNQGYTRDQAKIETDRVYGVQNNNRYNWVK